MFGCQVSGHTHNEGNSDVKTQSLILVAYSLFPKRQSKTKRSVPAHLQSFPLDVKGRSSCDRQRLLLCRFSSGVLWNKYETQLLNITTKYCILYNLKLGEFRIYAFKLGVRYCECVMWSMMFAEEVDIQTMKHSKIRLI